MGDNTDRDDPLGGKHESVESRRKLQEIRRASQPAISAPASQRIERQGSRDIPPLRSGTNRNLAVDGHEPSNRVSIMNDDMFGERYNYGMAEGATSNPLRFASAMGRDMGSLLMGSLGFGGKEENDPGKVVKSCCTVQTANLKKQADDINRKAMEGTHESKRKRSQRKDGQEQHPETIDEKSEDESGDTDESQGKSQHSDESPDKPDIEKELENAPEFRKASSASSSPSADITMSGSGQGHYDPKNDVILRLETMSSNETRFLVTVLWIWLLVAFAFLIYNFYQKLSDGDGAVKSHKQAVINVALASISLAAISLVCVTHAIRIIYNVRQGKVWKPRRRKNVIIVAVELAIQWCNLLFFLLPNAEELRGSCFRLVDVHKVTYYSLARWTCWNSFFLISLLHAHNSNIVPVKRSGASSDGAMGSMQKASMIKGGAQVKYKDAIVNDLPFWKMHWWKIVLWFAMECSILLATIYYGETQGKHGPPPHPVLQSCGEVAYFSCRVTNPALGLVSIMVFFTLVYFGLYCYYIAKAFEQLKTKSNTEFRIANQYVRLQVRLRLPAFTLFIFSLILLWYVRPFTCTSLYDTWLGMLPSQLAASGAVLLTMFVGTPKMIAKKERPPVLQVWLQEFCWSEQELHDRLARRNQTMAEDERYLIEKEPMFCVETMMKCLYWSLLIYDFEEVEDSRLSLAEGCALFSPPLDRYELFWEKSLDTKLLLAWSRKHIVLSFRGTASLANVLADVQAWRTNHYPKRNSWFTRPMVHNGFYKAWRNNRFNEKVLAKIEELYETNQVDRSDVKIIVTAFAGHSLGGALAVCSAFDIRSLGKRHNCDAKVTCITFGAPRVGNHAFSKEFEDMVPDCWHIINDQDVVARGAKFWVLYKRGGHRVLINKLGDLIVRPGPLEASLRLLPFTGSIQQHLLTSYLQSLLCVLLAQFSYKRLAGGMTGVVHLAQNSVPIKRLLMAEAGLDIKDLITMARWGNYAPRLAEVAKIPITGRKTGAILRDTKSRDTDDSPAKTTRGGFSCNCCAPIFIKVEARLSDRKHRKTDADREDIDTDDENIRDGGVTTETGQVPAEEEDAQATVPQ